MRSCTSRRAGFTLIELMIVLVVISILAGLLLPALYRARQTAIDAGVKGEIMQLDSALAQFKSTYGVSPPSYINLYTTQNGWAGDAYSTSIIRKIWPQFDFTMNNGSPAGFCIPDYPPWSTQTSITLQSTECLVFFLGGITTQVTPASPLPAPQGFSKNPAWPFAPPTGNGASREGPYFQFDPGRLIQSTMSVNSAPGIYVYRDQIAGQTNPYLYFSAYDGRGYNGNGLGANELIGLANDFYSNSLTIGAGPYYNPQTYQIISPGQDGQYGGGGYFSNSSANGGLSSPLDYDNITNFAGGRLVGR